MRDEASLGRCDSASFPLPGGRKRSALRLAAIVLLSALAVITWLDALDQPLIGFRIDGEILPARARAPNAAAVMLVDAAGRRWTADIGADGKYTLRGWRMPSFPARLIACRAGVGIVDVIERESRLPSTISQSIAGGEGELSQQDRGACRDALPLARR